MFSACGESFDSLQPQRVTLVDGICVCTWDPERLLKTKQRSRDKDRLDRVILERVIDTPKRKPTDR